jgi:hypothetical protein
MDGPLGVVAEGPIRIATGGAHQSEPVARQWKMLTPPGPTSRPTMIMRTPASRRPRTIHTIPVITKITAMSQSNVYMAMIYPSRTSSKPRSGGWTAAARPGKRSDGPLNANGSDKPIRGT